MLLVFVGLACLWTDPSHATRYWISPSGSDANACASIDGDIDPGVYRQTIVGGKSCMSGGDTLTAKAGTYTGTSNRAENFPSGTASAYTIFEGDPASSASCAKDLTCATIINNNGTYGVYTNLTSYFIVRNMKITSASNSAYPIDIGSAPQAGVSTNVIVRNIEATGSGASCIMNSALGHFTTIEETNLHDCTGGALGIYFQGDDGIIRNNWIHNNGYYGVQLYNSGTNSDGRPDRIKFYNNLIENNELGLFVEGNDNEIVGNVIRNTGSGIATTGLRPIVVHNQVGGAIAIGSYGSSNGAIVQNNIILGNVTIGSGTTSGTVTRSFNACRSIDSCGSNTLTIVDFSTVSISTSDYRLKDGSTAINAGTAASVSALRPCNGACDIGPNEAFGFSSAVVSGTTAEVTLGMNLHTPVVPTIAGWSLACTPNPTACPSFSLSAAVLKAGTSSTVQITYTGSACSAGQTWTASYSAVTGNTTNSVGLPLKQELTTTTNFAVNSSGCTGGGGPSPPGGLHIHYKLDEGTGTNANDETANNLDGTLMNSPTWGTGVDSNGVVMAAGTSQHIAIPYGSGVNPSTQSLTIAFWAKLTSEGLVFGSPVGTNQRLYIAVSNGTARIAIQGTNAGTASDLTVTLNDWTRFCLVMNSGTDTATLAVNGVASANTGGRKTYTSYALAGNFQLGRIDGNNAPGGTYDDFKLWTSVESCADDYAASNPPPPAVTAQYTAVGMRFYGAKTRRSGALIPLAALNTNITIVPGGAFALAVQTDGTVADPPPMAERLYYSCSPSPCSGSWLPVPADGTADGVYFWGTTVEPRLLSGAHGSNLSGALTHVNGGTNITADSIPVVDLAQDNSTVMRWIIRISSSAPIGRIFCFKPREQTGIDLNGGYTPSGGLCATVRSSVADGGF